MKKILLATAFIMMASLLANAQSDGYFRSYNSDAIYREPGEALDIENPGGHGLTDNQETPLGSGLLILTALGAGYAVARKKRS